MIHRTMYAFAIAAVIVLAPHHAPTAASAADAPKPASAAIVADAASIEPGGSFTIGLLLTIKPGWHAYWLNPGDSGKATHVAFTAPPGFTIGELQWPAPVKFMQAGDLVGYGYERELLLMAKVTVPATVKNGDSVSITADASWMVCNDVTCLEGRAKPALTLKVADKSAPANAELFDRWRARLPEPSAAAKGVFEPMAASGGAAIAVKWSAPVTQVDWYPAVGPDVLVEKVAVATVDAVTIIAYKAQRLGGEAAHVPGLLVFTDAAGKRRAIPLDGPLPAKDSNK